MREYLLYAFKYFEYENSDAQFLLSAYDKITADAECLKLWNAGIALYENDYMCYQGDILKIADEVAEKLYLDNYTTRLLAYICMTRHAKKLYTDHGYSEEIYKNSMLDLRYKLDECKAVRGVIGSFVAEWFYGFFTLERLALGRLQFELQKFGKTYEKDGKKLTPESLVINMHIPRSGAPMTPEACDDSFLQAKEIFKDKLGENVAFVCHSWLLYPENKDILSKHTNTYKFMERFEIIESEINNENDELWRLFDTYEQNPDRLPADSSMRRAYISHLKAGGKTGSGYGIFFL